MNNELYHFGIKGMKWGVRRADRGTPSSKLSRKKSSSARDMSDDDLASSVRRLNLENTYKTLTKKPTKVERTKKVVDSTSNLVGQVQRINKESMSSKKVREKLDLTKMTDQQLRERINRYNLEKQYNDLFATEKTTVSKGQKYASTILDVAGGALAVTGSALGIALAIKELRG